MLFMFVYTSGGYTPSESSSWSWYCGTVRVDCGLHPPRTTGPRPEDPNTDTTLLPSPRPHQVVNEPKQWKTTKTLCGSASCLLLNACVPVPQGHLPVATCMVSQATIH